MKPPWFRTKAGLFAKTKQELAANYPDLQLVIEDGTVFARGSLPVKDGADILDRFLIEIRFPQDFPDSVVVLHEIGGRIPWHEDRHTNRDGVSCPIVPEEWLIRPDRDSILAFLDGPVRNFFLGQMLVEQGKPWPFGERWHGRRGLLQAYFELLGTDDETVIYRYLDCLSKDIIRGHLDCPCGSKKRVRNCHREKLRELQQKIPAWIARRAVQRLGQ